MSDRGTLIFLLILCVIALVLYDFSGYFNQFLVLPDFVKAEYKLGLDLVGGTMLVYQADLSKVEPSQRQEALENTRDLIEQRVNAIGIAEPKVTYSATEGRITVELASVRSPEEAKRIIGETPFLEFRELRTEAEKQEILDAQKKGERLSENAEFAEGELTGKYVANARVDFDSYTNEPVVGLQFNAEGARLFEEITKRNVEKPLAIFLDNRLISAPTVREAISGGRAQISGGFTLTEARELAGRLNLGALPIPISPISESSVSGTVGREVLDQIVTAGVIGFTLVALFIILYYRLSGIGAALALAFYVLLNLAIYKLFGVVLTLSGIAGFILSLGMAVDANILIFERTREELKTLTNADKTQTRAEGQRASVLGQDLSAALERGFSRAWPSVRDSNLTTIIANVVMFVIATSFVKGFALTLTLGVLTSLLTSIWISRLIVGALFERVPRRNLLLP